MLDPHTLVLEDFESPDSLERWDAGDNEVVLAERSDAWSTAGDHSLRITFLESPTWSSLDTVRAAFDEWPDFGEYEYVEIDFFNPTDFPGPTEDSNSQGVVFFAEGSSPNSVSVALQPDSERSWKVSIHDQLAFEKGDPVNVSRIEKLHFYAWNPSRDYVRHVDNIRLTRDLGRHFTEMKSSLEILETAGLDENRLDQLRGEIKAERERLAQLPFNKRNFKQAREDIQNLKEALGAETVFVDQFDERFHELLGRREWTETTRHALLELDKSLLEARRNVRELELSSGAREGFAAETLERVRAELTRVEADLDNARTFLPYASRDRDFVLGWTSTDHFVKPYGTSFEGSFGPIELSGARGETVGAQVVVFALDHIPEMGFELPARHVNISGLGFANIGTAAENSTPHKLQWYPDIIYPLSKGAVKIPAGRLQPLLLDVHIPKDISAGLYFFDLKAKAGGASVTLPIALRVYDFSLPENFSLATTSGFRFPNGLLLPEYGLDAGHLYGGWSDADDDRILEFFERGQRLFNLRNLGSARISRMLERGPEYVRERYEPFLQRMEEIGIPRKHFFFYGLDEVSVNAAEEMRALNALLQESLGVPLMATPLGGDWVDEPADILSIWAGGLGSGETRRERIRDIHDAGGKPGGMTTTWDSCPMFGTAVIRGGMPSTGIWTATSSIPTGRGANRVIRISILKVCLTATGAKRARPTRL